MDEPREPIESRISEDLDLFGFDDPSESWVDRFREVADEIERDMSAGASDQVRVRVHIPKGTPTGKYTFALRAYSTDDPEQFADSPMIAVEVPAATVHATDVSRAALAVAGRNAARHRVADRVTFHHGSFLTPLEDVLPPASVHVVVFSRSGAGGRPGRFSILPTV